MNQKIFIVPQNLYHAVLNHLPDYYYNFEIITLTNFLAKYYFDDYSQNQIILKYYQKLQAIDLESKYQRLKSDLLFIQELIHYDYMIKNYQLDYSQASDYLVNIFDAMQDIKLPRHQDLKIIELIKNAQNIYILDGTYTLLETDLIERLIKKGAKLLDLATYQSQIQILEFERPGDLISRFNHQDLRDSLVVNLNSEFNSLVNFKMGKVDSNLVRLVNIHLVYLNYFLLADHSMLTKLQELETNLREEIYDFNQNYTFNPEIYSQKFIDNYHQLKTNYLNLSLEFQEKLIYLQSLDINDLLNYLLNKYQYIDAEANKLLYNFYFDLIEYFKPQNYSIIIQLLTNLKTKQFDSLTCNSSNLYQKLIILDGSKEKISNFKAQSGIFDENFLLAINYPFSLTERKNHYQKNLNKIFNSFPKIDIYHLKANFDGKIIEIDNYLVTLLNEGLSSKITIHSQKNKLTYKKINKVDNLLNYFMEENKINLSASKIESYFYNPLNFLIENLLKINNFSQIQALIHGNILHLVLEKSFKKQKFMEQLLKEELKNFYQLFKLDYLFLSQYDYYLNSLKNIFEQLTQRFKNFKFISEQRISKEIVLGKYLLQQNLKIDLTIDSDDLNLIIDFKSSNKKMKFDLEGYQLLIYYLALATNKTTLVSYLSFKTNPDIIHNMYKLDKKNQTYQLISNNQETIFKQQSYFVKIDDDGKKEKFGLNINKDSHTKEEVEDLLIDILDVMNKGEIVDDKLPFDRKNK